MPELPEMETYCRFLSQNIMRKPITDIEVNREKSLNVPESLFVSELKGRNIIGIKRRAKHLIFDLNSGKHLILHLMLGGWMFLGNEGNSPDRTKQVILSFGELKLYFIGLRLGYLHLLTTEELEEKLADIGPEPLKISLEEFHVRIKKRRGALKPLLVDPKFIAGIGNCYSDEICFEARLLTTKKAQDLTSEHIAALYQAFQPVFRKAISTGGYMDHPMYEGDKKTGGYNNEFLVYEREGERCYRCGSTIKRIEVSSRKSFYCPNCQR
jgi:formamidopyrimidine-DNA glycosylase